MEIINSEHLIKLKIVFVIFLALTISITPFIPAILNSLSDTLSQIDKNHEKEHLHFLKENSDLSNSILFIGSSTTMYGVNVTQIEQNLKDEKHEFEIYNLGMESDSPLRRLIELNSIIDSKPKLVIIGIDYFRFNYTLLDCRTIYLLNNWDKLDSKSKEILTQYFESDNNRQYSLRNQNKIYYNILYKKEDVLKAISSGGLDTALNKFSNNYNEKYKYVVDDNLIPQQSIETKINNSNELKYILYPDGPKYNSQKYAFEYFIEKLSDNGIYVIIILMPTDPIYLQKVSENSIKDVEDYLNITTKSKSYINYLDKYPSDYFYDNLHMNPLGRENFSVSVSLVIDNYLDNLQ